MDRGAWWATAHRVTESQTGLKQLCTHTNRAQACLLQGLGPLLLGMFPSRTPLREPFSSPARPGLVSAARGQGSKPRRLFSPTFPHIRLCLCRGSHRNRFCFLIYFSLSLPPGSSVEFASSDKHSGIFSLPPHLCRRLFPTAGDINFSSFPHHLENILRFLRFK